MMVTVCVVGLTASIQQHLVGNYENLRNSCHSQVTVVLLLWTLTSRRYWNTNWVPFSSLQANPGCQNAKSWGNQKIYLSIATHQGIADLYRVALWGFLEPNWALTKNRDYFYRMSGQFCPFVVFSWDDVFWYTYPSFSTLPSRLINILVNSYEAKNVESSCKIPHTSYMLSMKFA